MSNLNFLPRNGGNTLCNLFHGNICLSRTIGSRFWKVEPYCMQIFVIVCYFLENWAVLRIGSPTGVDIDTIAETFFIVSNIILCADNFPFYVFICNWRNIFSIGRIICSKVNVLWQFSGYVWNSNIFCNRVCICRIQSPICRPSKSNVGAWYNDCIDLGYGNIVFYRISIYAV